MTPQMMPEREFTSATSPTWRRVRPPWLVAALSFASFDLYVFYWLFTTWRELKTERSDSSMSPGWHLLAIMLVPIYGYFRFHAHMRIIREFAQAHGVTTSLNPAVCVLVWIVSSQISRVTLRLTMRGFETPLWVDLVTSTALAALLIWAQSALNAAWQVLPADDRTVRIHPLEWTVIVVGGVLLLLALLG